MGGEGKGVARLVSSMLGVCITDSSLFSMLFYYDEFCPVNRVMDTITVEHEGVTLFYSVNREIASITVEQEGVSNL